MPVTKSCYKNKLTRVLQGCLSLHELIFREFSYHLVFIFSIKNRLKMSTSTQTSSTTTALNGKGIINGDLRKRPNAVKSLSQVTEAGRAADKKMDTHSTYVIRLCGRERAP